MGLASWIRERLWRADDWCAELAALRAAPAKLAERTFDLARATEYCDPDRSRAMTLYLTAWRAGHAAAKAPALALARALRAHMAVAEIAAADRDHFTTATAFIDAGFPELAIEPLQKLVDARPGGASVETEHLRLEGVHDLLALARKHKLDVEQAIEASLARARQATGRVAAHAYLHAARIARIAKLDDRRGAILAAAERACPGDAEIAQLVEERLFERNDANELLAHYRKLFESAPTRADYVERTRAAGVELIARNLQPGLGLRLLRLALESAYEALLPEITSHVAAWELLFTHAKAHDSVDQLVPLIVKAMTAPLPEDDALYLARLGLDIAWRHVGDTVAAEPYAAMLLDFVADHSLATKFLEAIPESAVEPVVRFTASQPIPKPTPQPAARQSGRIPIIEDGPVKRSVVPSSTQQRPTGRLALLTPRPPPTPPREDQNPPKLPPPTTARVKTLRRHVSPIPQRKRPTAEPMAARAPRKVVPIDVVVELGDGAFFSTVLRDLSTSGSFIVTKRGIEVGALVTVELRLPDPGRLAQSTHRVNARVARRTEVGCGIAFVDLSPALLAAIRAMTG